MCHDRSLLRQNLVYLHAGVILTMPDGALVLFFALELEDNRLFTAALRGNGALYARRTQRGARFDRVAVNDRDHAIEFYVRAHIACQGFDFDRFAWRDTVLFTTGFNDCVH